jgi:hypothetical protein
MATQAETRIGDLKIAVSKLPAMRAVKLSARLGKIIGPTIAAGMPSAGVLRKVSSFADLDVNFEQVARALFDRLDPDELEALLRELLAATTLNGQPIMETFDLVFADQLENVIPVVKFVLGFQFGSFGRALLAAGGAVMAQAGSPESPST